MCMFFSLLRGEGVERDEIISSFLASFNFEMIPKVFRILNPRATCGERLVYYIRGSFVPSGEPERQAKSPVDSLCLQDPSHDKLSSLKSPGKQKASLIIAVVNYRCREKKTK